MCGNPLFAVPRRLRSPRNATKAPASEGLFGGIKRWWLYRQTMNELSRLSDRELYDIGVLRSELESVASKAAAAR